MSLSGELAYTYPLTLDGLDPLATATGEIIGDYIAADQVVKDACVLKTGSTMTGGLVISNVTTPIQLSTASTALTMALTAGSLAAPQVCTLKLCSTTSSNLDFRDYSDVSQASMFYASVNSELRFNVGTNTNVFRIGGTQVTAARNLSMGTTNRIVNLSPGTGVNDAINFGQSMLRSGVNAALADIPMGGFKLVGLGLATVATDAASKSYVDDANTAQTTAITTAYTAADALKLNLSGGNITGAITSSIVQPLNFTNSTGPVQLRMSAGNTTVTQLATIQMCSNSAGIIDFQDNTNTTKAKIQYTFGTPGAISLIVGGSQVLSASDTTLACGIINMQQNRIFNLAPTPTTDQDAVPRLYMQNADSAVAANATAALTVEVNARVASVGNEASTRAAQDALRLKLDGTTTMTGPLNLGSQRLTNLATSTTGSDGCRSDEVLLLNGTRQMSGIANFGGFKASNSAYGSPGSADLCTVAQMEAGDLAVTNARITAENLKLDKTGSSALTMTGVSNALNITNTGGTLNTNFTAGTAAAPQSYYQIMTSNVQSLLDFRGNDGVQRAFFRYLYGSPGALELSVNNTLLLSVAPSVINMYQALNMNSMQISGLAAATGAGNAVRYDQTVLRTGVNAMQGSLSFGTTNKITNLAAGTSGTADAANCTQALMRDGTLPMLGSVDWNGYAINNLGPGTSPLGAVNYNQIAFSLIPISVYHVGDTTERQCLAGTLGHGLVTSSFGPGSNDILVSTQMQCNAGNQVHVRGQFEINSSGFSNDAFHVVVRLSTTEFVQFNEVFPTETGYRTRNYTWDTAWTIASSFLRTITIRLYNDSGTDTTTVNGANFKYTLEQFQG